MASVTLPPVHYLVECFDYNKETGELHWRIRPASHFKCDQHARAWNNRNAGKPITRIAKGYLTVGINGRKLSAHRVIYKMMTGEEPIQVDHINLCRTDNRWANLRNSTPSENSNNAPARTSNPKGVVWDKNWKAWRAQIRKNYTRHYSGPYKTAEEAHEAYCEMARKLHGEFFRGS